MISVPTPLRDGLPDLSYIEQAGRNLARFLRPGVLRGPRDHDVSGHDDGAARPDPVGGLGPAPATEFFVGYSPERIDPGNAALDLVNTPKVVSGSTPASLAVVDAFFSRSSTRRCRSGRAREAELVKLLENTFRHVNIALVNEIGDVRPRPRRRRVARRSTRRRRSRSAS